MRNEPNTSRLRSACTLDTLTHSSVLGRVFDNWCVFHSHTHTAPYSSHARTPLPSQSHTRTQQTRANVHDVSYHIIQYTNIIADLRREIQRLKTQLASRKEPTAFLAPQMSGAGEAVAELREVHAKQGSTRQELVSTTCELAQNAFDVQRTRLKQ